MQEQPAATIDFHVIQSHDFKTLYASGLYSSTTLNGLVNLNFFIDRQPLPDLMTYSIDNNVLGNEKTRIIRSGIVREVQQGVVMDIQTAKNVITLLTSLIATHEQNNNVV